MKKIKLFLLSAAALFGVTAAFAFTTEGPCDNPANRLYLDGTVYRSVLTLPNGYQCIGSAGTCTYVEVGGVIQPCEKGTFKKN